MARVRLMDYIDGERAFQWGETGEPRFFEPEDDDSLVIAFTKAVNDGIEAGDDIEGEAAQAVAEVLKASGDVVWNGERTLNDWREDICAQLPKSSYACVGDGPTNTYYYVDDLALDGSKVLICGCEKGETYRWVAEVTVQGDEPVLSPRAQWVEVEEQFVAKAGRKFSNRHFDAMRAAHEALTRLITVGETERAPKDESEEIVPETVPAVKGAEMSYTVTKADSPMRYTLGPLYAPMRKDAHGEYVEDDVLHKSLHEFVRDSAENGRRIELQHGDQGEVQVGEWVEVVRWPYEHTIKMRNTNGAEHEVEMPAGTTYLGVVWDEDYWDVEKGAPKGINGYSLGGVAVKVRDDSETLKDMGYKVRKAAGKASDPPEAAPLPAVDPPELPVVKESSTEAETETALSIVSHGARLSAERAALAGEVTEGRSLLRRTLDVLEKQAERDLPEQHIHLPTHDLTVHSSDVTVEVEKGKSPDVHVHVPETFNTIPAETETVAERGHDGLISRSVTRPTGN